ncbi:MAG: putative quinol monooxygenase [Bryobacteraceae bacterium]|jgi:quinol monooxygenase YgiN
MRLSITALLLFAVSVVLYGQDSKLYVVTHVDLTPNYTVDGTKLLQTFASDSHKDKGVVRFELLQDVGRKNHFTMVEVWDNQAAFEAHLEANHTKQFREKLQPMLGSPFDERLHNIMQ